MIVKMKKLLLLSTKARREQTLEALRDLGVVHVVHVEPPSSDELETARRHLQHVREVTDILRALPDAPPTDDDPHAVIDRVSALLQRKKELAETLQALRHEVARIEPFGDFDPRDVERLRDAGLVVRLYELPLNDPPDVPETVALSEISRNKQKRYVLAVARETFSIPAHEVRLPDRSLSRIRRHIERKEKALAEADAELRRHAGDAERVARVAREAAERVTYLEVREGAGDAEHVIYLQGYFPAEREADLAEAAKRNGWGYRATDVSDADDPPTLLRNPKWVSPIKAVLKMIGVVPGYRELDVSALFLIFLSIFFAFIIGDGGYGVLFLSLTLFFKFKTRGRKAAQPALDLMLLMSACTVVFGMLTGNWFGIPIESLPGFMKDLTVPYVTGWTEGRWDPDLAANHVMFICFSIAVVHLGIAHLWNVVRKINSFAALVDLGWLFCTCSLYTFVLNMVLYLELPPLVQTLQLPLLGAGAGLVALGLILTKSYFGLVTLFLDLIGNFVDVISYVRLYAVGAASLAIAQAFNGMAADIGFSGIGALGAAFILFAGHGLNVILGAMGVMVHGIRLNTLEFSGHAGVEWAGSPFAPFGKGEDL